MKSSTQWSCLLALGLSAAAALAQETDNRAHEGSDYTSRVFVRGTMGRGFLGVQLTPLTPELRTHFGVAEDTGVMVSRVESGGPAEAAGIQVGDILTAVDGERVDGPRPLARAVRSKKEGDLVDVELYREGAMHSYTVSVRERDREVIDLSGGYRFISEMGELPDHDMVIRAPGLRVDLDEESAKALEDAMRELDERFDSPEWHERIERFSELDFTQIEQRMELVERRLRELEDELKGDAGEKK